MPSTDRIIETRSRARRVALAVTLFCAGLCAVAGGAHAGSLYAGDSVAVPSAPHYHPPIWTASLPGHPTLLLLPTLHGLASDDPRIDATLASLADGVQAIVLETNVYPSRENVQTILRIGLYPVSDNLSNHVHSMTAESLARCARDSGADIKVFFQHKPWLAGFVIEAVRQHVDRFEWKAGAKRPRFVQTGAPSVFPGIDARLETIAARRQIPVIYLETMEQGMHLFDDMPDADQEAFLQSECAALHGVRQGLASYAQFQQAWTSGDAAQLERYAMARYAGESDAHYDFSQYLYVRGTDIFAATMARDGYFYGKGPILVAVGAGHFFGAHSLLQHLRDAGYTVTGPAPRLQAQLHAVASR
jgi:uncharacterized protein YbaP (TraB family)